MVHPKAVVGIIGGKGQMGEWFARWFEMREQEVLISDVDTQLTNEELVRTSDVVVFSVPIARTEEVIRSVVGFSRPEQLWMDLTSIKEKPINAMLLSKAQVVGLHPMFGAMVSSMKEQTVIVCNQRVDSWEGWIENCIQASQGVVKHATAQEHDAMMAVVQGLTHFSAITIGYALRELGVDVEKSLEYTSPVYRMHLNIGSRILGQDPHLYTDIQTENFHVREVLRVYLQAVSKLYHMVEHKDKEAFLHYFQQAAEHFGEYRNQAQKESDAMIEYLVNKKDFS